VKEYFKDFDFSVFNHPEYKEDSVREDIISPILKMLGYKSSGKNQIIRSKAVKHPLVKTGAQEHAITNFPDYVLSVNDRYVFVLDAKSPGEEIKLGKNVEQVYFYAIHPEIRVNYYALCNGREFILFEISRQEPVLYFSLSEFEKYFDKLDRLLSAASFSKTFARRIVRNNNHIEFDYMSRKLLSEIPVRKQAAKRYYGVHGYFTKQAWNVVQEYIKNFTKPSDLILDPFGGSGVTIIESLILGRKGIHIDINPLSKFIVDALLTPINCIKLNQEFDKLKNNYLKGEPKTKEEIKLAIKKYPFLKDVELPKNADVRTVDRLFTEKQLAKLAYLKFLIRAIRNESIRKVFLLCFSSTLTKINRTYHCSKQRTENAGDAAAFRYYRYRIAPKPIDLDLWDTFESKFGRILKAKKEVAQFVNEDNFAEAVILQGTATKLELMDESVDYIYTDPPYGSKIQYLDLSIMWNTWLDLNISQTDHDLEIIEGGMDYKTYNHYSSLLRKSILEMYRVLKFDRWMSFVFAHKDPKYWHLIVNTAEEAGFEYVGAVKQSNGQTSFKKRQKPFSVLAGQLIINFKKVKNPAVIQRVKIGADIFHLIIETIEGIIAKNDGATLEEINDELIIRGLELGFLDILSKEYKDITPILLNYFEFDDKTEKFYIIKKFKSRIPIELRIKYYLISYLRRKERENIYPTTDELVLEIMPLLKNGDTPDSQTILNELKKIAIPVGFDGWRLIAHQQLDLIY